MHDFHKKGYDLSATPPGRPGQAGVGLVEILITLVIFSILMATVYSSFVAQTRQAATEYRLAEAEMELGISKNILERDLGLAGYGLADDYDFDDNGTQNFSPKVATATNSDTAPDVLFLRGTGLGLASRATQAWTYISAVSGTPQFQSWLDNRENFRSGVAETTRDTVVLMEPRAKKLIDQGNNWHFRFDGYTSQLFTAASSAGTTGTQLASPQVGTLVYGLQSRADTPPTQPYYTVRFSLYSTNLPAGCAPGTSNLMRVESTTSDNPANPAAGEPILSCVLDFQVVFGLDTDENGDVNFLDNGGTQVSSITYSASMVKRRLKQIRMYVLVQYGKRDDGYTYPDSDILVGEPGVGRTVSLTTAQRNYRWKLLKIYGTLRNAR